MFRSLRKKFGNSSPKHKTNHHHHHSNVKLKMDHSCNNNNNNTSSSSTRSSIPKHNDDTDTTNDVYTSYCENHKKLDNNNHNNDDDNIRMWSDSTIQDSSSFVAVSNDQRHDSGSTSGTVSMTNDINDCDDDTFVFYVSSCHFDSSTEKGIIHPIQTPNTSNGSIPPLQLFDSIDSDQHNNSNNDRMVEYIECVLPLHYEMKQTKNNKNPKECVIECYNNNNDECSIVTASTVTTLTSTTIHPSCCTTYHGKVLLTPSLHPKDWPQYPLLLRPTPGSGTHIIGVRHIHSKQYLWQPSMGGTWHKHTTTNTTTTTICHECCGLPINNGNEGPGEALVIDFETPLFQGTLLVRIRHSSHPISNQSYSDSYGYFQNFNRQYQAVIRGTFQKPLPISQCVTGNLWKKPLDKLPSPWILNATLKLAKIFAPQSHLSLKATDNATTTPYTLSPLGSTPQVITKSTTSTPMDAMHEEPQDEQYTILPPSTSNKTTKKNNYNNMASSSTARAKRRKRIVDQWVVRKDVSQKFETNVVYTFEFLQHLIHFHSLQFDAGTSLLRPFNLAPSLNGQPLQIMAAHHHNQQQQIDPSSILKDITPIWSFDIFHESLIPAAQRHDRN